MPRYRLPSGVVVETSEENGARISGATADGSGSSKKAPAAKKASAPAKDTSTDK